jgi:ABC-type transport system involved in multi-copper enzyme maturation permease subunit
MFAHIGLCPVFAFEWLRASRRWQLYAMRCLFVALLLVGVYIVWLAEVGNPDRLPTIRQQAQVGEKLYYAMVGIQLALVLLAAPAATAGAVCLDKTRGALVHLLVTDLSAVEIILGKLAARLMPVLGLIGCSLPLLFLSTLFGGLDPEALIGAILVTLGVAVLGCSLALMLSVWASKTYEVLLATYMVWTLVMLANPIWKAVTRSTPALAPPPWFEDLNPFWLAFAPYSNPGTVRMSEQAGFLGVCLALSAGLVLLAIARVRPVTVRQMSRSDRPRPRRARFELGVLFRWLPGPSLDSNPVLWREWHRTTASRWVRLVWFLYIGLACVCTLAAIIQAKSRGGFAVRELPLFVNAFQVAIGLLLLSIGAVTSLAEERVRGSLEVLLTTPLPTRSILWGKWWGAYRRVPLQTILPCALCAVLLEYPGKWLPVYLMAGLVLAYGAAITSLGLALATWLTRLGRAVALSVMAYVFVTAGWIFIAMALFQRVHGDTVRGLAGASPWFGAAMLTHRAMNMTRYSHYDDYYPVWEGFWIALCIGAAVLLALGTLATFDRCLGRIAFQPWRTRLRREARPVGSVAGIT